MKFFISLCMLLLIGAGVAVIYTSHCSYQKSLKHYEVMQKLFVDDKFIKQPVVLPTPGYSLERDGYSQALPYFMLALGVGLGYLLLPRIQNLSIGPGGVTFALREVQQNLSALIQQNNTMQAESVGIGGKGQPEAIHKFGLKPDSTNADDDPQKGKWGGKSENGSRRLSADVKETDIKGLFRVTLRVNSINADNLLKGIVKFHLHPTFKNPTPVIAAQNGEAVLELPYAYGAFTVGAEADNGETKLEYDLAENTQFPPEFRSR